jgi:PTS system mannose-specific IID component
MKGTRQKKGEALISRRTRAEMVVRSLFIQATNNFERMLSLGFLFALWPVIKKKYAKPEARRGAVIRHLSFFNTQPYLANCILGVVANAELRDGRKSDADVGNIKRAMMGALGALGDDLFWTGLMPAAALVALLLYAALPRYALAWAIVALVIYNIFQFWARIRLFDVGLRLGPHITTYLKMLRLPQFALAVKVAAAFTLGLVAATLVWRAGHGAAFGLTGGLAVAAAVALSLVLQSIGVRSGLCWYVVAAVAVTLGTLVL